MGRLAVCPVGELMERVNQDGTRDSANARVSALRSGMRDPSMNWHSHLKTQPSRAEAG
jgi:hypothetical protein